MLALGPLAVLHGILDVVVDGYQEVVDELAHDIEEVEERVFSEERTDDAASIYLLKRENLEVRRAIDPLRPVADHLLHEQLPDLPHHLLPYFRDLGDHLLRVQERSSAARRPARRPSSRPLAAAGGAAERRHAQDLGLGRRSPRCRR